MPGPWKAWKSKNGFPTLPTAPWKSRKTGEISTFPQPSFATANVSLTQNKPAETPMIHGDDLPLASELSEVR